MNRHGRRTFHFVYAAWLFGIFAFFIPAATWNPVSRLDLTRAIVERHTLSIDAYAATTGDRALVAGQWFSDKAPLPSIAAVPVYSLLRGIQRVRGVSPQYQVFSTPTTPAVRLVPNTTFQQSLYVCSLVTGGVGGVAIGLLLFELMRRRMPARWAMAASAAAVLGSPILPYATSYYGHVPAGAALLGALVALDARGQRWADGIPERGRVRIAGACLAVAPGCEYITAAPAALIGIAFLARTPPRALARVIADLVLGALAPVLVVGAYHTAAFGAPWKTGYSFIARPEFAAGHARGLLGINLPRWDGVVGLSIGTRRGLFYLAPVLAVGLLVGFSRAIRTRDRTVVTGLAAFSLLFLMNAGYYMWWGGAAGGPRHVVPAIAMLAFGIGVALRRRSPWLSRATALLALVSVANCVGLTIVGLEAPEDGDILGTYVWPMLRAGLVSQANGATNVGMKLGLSAAFSPLPLLLWLGIGYFYLSRLVAPRQLRALTRTTGKGVRRAKREPLGTT